MSRVTTKPLLVVLTALLVSCGGSSPRWVPSEALLAKIVTMDPETEPVKLGKAVRQFFDEASLDGGPNRLKGKTRESRYLTVFEVLRSRYRTGGAVTAGFNICFPESYSPSNRYGIPQLMIFGWQCQLIQRDGPSVALLRKDPLVSKYLDADGNLVARGDLDEMHDEINGAFYRMKSNDSLYPLYSEAVSNLEKVTKQ